MYLLRKLNPYAGYLDSGGGGGGGGGGGSSSDSFDAEFEAAIAQDEANKASGGGGISYGGSGYVGSSSSTSSSDFLGAPAPTYTANDGTTYSTQAAADQRNATLAAEEEARLQAEFDAAVAADYALKDAYNVGSTNIFSGADGEVSYYTYDDATGKIDYISSPTVQQIEEANLNKTIYDSNQLAIDYGLDGSLSNVAIEDASQSYWDNVLGFLGQDATKVTAAGEFDAAVNEFAVQDYLQRSGYDTAEYDTKELGSLWNDFTYSTADNYNFGNFIDQYNYLKDNTSNALYDGDVVVKEMNGENMLFASDPFSFEGITANLGDFLINTLGGYMGGMVLGDVIYAATGNPMAALGGATVGDKVISNVGLVDNQVFLGADGVQYIQTNSVFGEPSFTPIDTAVNNATQAAETSQYAISSGDFDMGSSLQMGISGASVEEPLTYSGRGDTPSWKDYYNLDLNPMNAVTEVITGATINPEVYKAAQLAQQLDAGQSLTDAAINVYGSDIVSFLPEDFKNPTEAAIRIGAGENRVAVLGDIYGSDIGLDNPLGQGALSTAVTYDQTGDGQQALTDGLITYVKEGGTFPEFTVPDFLPDTVDTNFDFDWLSGMSATLPDLSLGDWVNDFQLPTGVFDGVNWNAITDAFADVSLPELPEFNIDIKGLDFSGVSFADLGGLDLPEMIDLGVDIPEINFDGVNFADLNMSLPEIQDLGIDWEGLNFNGVPLPELLLAGGAEEEAEKSELGYIDPFADTTEEEDTLPKKTSLSQALLKSTPVA